MITPSIPAVPAPLPEGATAAQIATYWQQMDVYLRCVQEANNVERHNAWLAECAAVQLRHAADLAARQAHAQAQADTAVAMAANVQAVQASAEAMREPQWTKQGLTLWFLARLPEITGLTDLARTDLAVKQAEALLSRIPSP